MKNKIVGEYESYKLVSFSYGTGILWLTRCGYTLYKAICN
jgi:hypothetical protein